MYSIKCLPMLLANILEGSTGDLLSTAKYYDRLAAHIEFRDNELMSLLTQTIVHVQNTYRSALQYDHQVSMIPMEKRVDDLVREFLEQDCPICLQKLKNDARGVVRIECGHFMHRPCFLQFETHHLAIPKTCPACRHDLGLFVNLWDDHESAVPKF